jgi:peptidylglycine monooxygenase
VEPDWSRVGESVGLGAISKLASDRAGRIYACQRTDPFLVRLGVDGRIEATWTDPTVIDPHGMHVGVTGNLLVVDRDGHRIHIFDDSGRKVAILGDHARPRFQAPFNHPTDIAQSPHGDLFVADGYGNSMVHRFAADGRHIRSWGSPGRGPGEFSTPHGICILAGDRVAVGDRENNRIQVFDFDGTLQGIWQDVYHPMEICVDREGYVYVSDQTPRISMFSSAGELAGRCRAPLPSVAHGMAIDPIGNIFLAGPRAAAVVRLKRLEG